MLNKEAGQKTPGIFALKAQGLCSELHQSDAKRKSPLKDFSREGCRSLRSQSVASALGLRSGATPAEMDYINRHSKHWRAWLLFFVTQQVAFRLPR